MRRAKTICKFTVVSVKKRRKDAGGGETVKLEAAYDEVLAAEDRHFSNMTPTGSMELACQDPALVGTFTKGDEFYVELVPMRGGK